VGVILGIPAYAAIKVVIANVFEWYKRISNLYEEETEVVSKE
jgi:predicted PurR-regulated permease PerM